MTPQKSNVAGETLSKMQISSKKLSFHIAVTFLMQQSLKLGASQLIVGINDPISLHLDALSSFTGA